MIRLTILKKEVVKKEGFFFLLQKICRTKTLRFGLLSLFIFSSLSIILFVPKKVEAQGLFVPVNDLAGNSILSETAATTLLMEGYIQAMAIKQTGPTPGVPVPFTSLDSIMKLAVKMLIKQMTSSIVQWINSGFNGNPSFVSNPAQFFTGVADRTAGAFIEGSQLAFLCSPFGLDIKLALGLKYFSNFSRDTIGCTLGDVIGNVQGFTNFTKGGDFSGSGGWNSWLQLTAEPQNSPQGALLLADSEMRVQIAERNLLEGMQLNWGKGFLSFKKCYAYSEGPNQGTGEGDGGGCIDERIVTPGTVIESQLENTLGSDLRQYELAKSFDDIISALANQLIGQALSATGLLGASEPSSAFDGKSFIERLQAQKASCSAGQTANNSSDCANSLIATSTTVAPIPLPTETKPTPTTPQNPGGSVFFQDEKVRPAKASQTSTYIDESNSQFDAGQAIDGSTVVAGNYYGFSSTNATKPGEYWEADLGTVESLKSIEIYQRLVYSLANVEVLLSLDGTFPKGTIPIKKINSASSINPITIPINPPIKARYIRIVQKTQAYLDLAEVIPYRNVKPVILGANNITIQKGATFDPLLGVTAKDLEDGDILPTQIVVGGSVDTTTAGTYTITYDVMDSTLIPGDQIKRIVTVQ